MFPRNSHNKVHDNAFNAKPYANISKADALKLFEQLEASFLNAKFGNTTQDQMSNLRSLLKLIHFYAVIKIAFAANKLLAIDLNRSDFIDKALRNNTNINYHASTVLSDVNHVEKIMTRYNLDFDKAFDFWVMSNLMREQFKIRSGILKLFDVADKITVGELVMLGKKAYITEQQIKDIYPALTVKMSVSKAKKLVADHKNNVNDSTLKFCFELNSLNTSAQQRLGK